MDFVESGADLVADAGPDFFNDIPVDSSPAGGSESTEPETFDTPGEIDEYVDDAPVGDQPLEEEEPLETTPAAPKPEDLPEGVQRGKNSQGKDGLFVKPDRWETIHGGYKTVQQISEILGEPATLEAMQLRERAFQAQEMLFNDINSGDPASQAKVVNYFLDQMIEAKQNGEIGIDATVPFAQSVYSAIQEKSPEAHAQLTLLAVRDSMASMWEKAARSGDDNLRLGLQHVVRALTGGTDAASTRAIAERMGLPFYSKDEMAGLAKGPDQYQSIRQENERLKAQLEGRSTSTQAAQLADWKKQTWTSMESGVNEDVVQPALTAIAEAWKPFPAEYKEHVIDKLHSKLDGVLRADPVLKDKISRLQSQAAKATSAQVRSRIAAEIRQAWVNRANLALDGIKRPVLESANKILTGLSNSNHARRQAAQGRTAPTRGAQGPVTRSLTPPKSGMNGTFDPGMAVKEANALFR